MNDGRTRDAQAVHSGNAHAFLEKHRASLTVLRGPYAGTEFALEGSRSIAGRSAKAEIRLDDESVSSEHAAFELDGQGFGVRDLASTNGVLVNGAKTPSIVLEHGDRIQLGDCELQYVVEDRPLPPKTWRLDEEA